MKKIITLAGSSSKTSINKQLAEYVGSLVGGAKIKNLDLNDYELPLYSIDLENEKGFPTDLLELNNEIEETDGIVLSLAEHNGSYAAAFKNAFDWLSRIDGKVWRGKPMLLLSTSPGARGGQSVMEAAMSRFPFNGGNVIASMSFPSFNDNFEGGRITNEGLKQDILSRIDLLNKSI